MSPEMIFLGHVWGSGCSFPEFLTYLAQDIVIKAFIASFGRTPLFERDVQSKKQKTFRQKTLTPDEGKNAVIDEVPNC